MKVVIISTNDYEGGAARGAYRLNQALNSSNAGIASSMIVQKKQSSLNTINGPISNLNKVVALLRPHVDKLPLLFSKQNTQELISSNWLSNHRLVELINAEKPDVVNLHWVNKGFLSLDDFHRIKAPIVFTVHDSWIATGGCHIIGDCKQYVDGCSSCPKLDNKFKFFDPVQWNATKKRAVFSNSSHSFVAVSRWMKSVMQESAILRNKPVTIIPNTLDCSVFRVIDKQGCRAILGIEHDQRTILCFGAMSAFEDSNKGGDLLLNALSFLDPTKYRIIIFGASGCGVLESSSYDIKFLGEIKDELMMAVVYNASDIFIMPSRVESFGQTASEAMACGTPVCAFATSGLLDIVDHKVNGYLATPFDTLDLAKGIEWLSGNKATPKLQEECVRKAVDYFSFARVSDRYRKLFSEVIHCQKQGD